MIKDSFSLAVGETRKLIIKLFAPSNVPQGQINITTITATFGEAADQQVSATDTTTASNAVVSITKTAGALELWQHTA